VREQSSPCAEAPRRGAVAIRPLTRREYRLAVATWQDIIRTFPWDRAPHGPRTARAAAVDLLATLTIAICDYETSSPFRRLRDRLVGVPNALSVTTALARYRSVQVAEQVVGGDFEGGYELEHGG
jgi:hypothetical protein